MLGVRLLVVLSQCGGMEELADTVLGAVAAAARPFSLRFALPRGMEEILDQLPREAVGGVTLQNTLVFYEEEQGLAGVLPLLTDETHFLSLKGPYAFQEKWDQELLGRLQRLPERKGLLTATLSGQEEALPPQAYLPAFGQVFREDGIRLARGLPLVCAEAPVKTLVVDPGLVAGLVDFLHQAELLEAWLSIAAFVAGFPVYALEQVVLWPIRKPPGRWLQRPGPDSLPKHFWARFEQFAGISLEQRLVGVRSSLGLFSNEGSYAQRMPMPKKLALQAKAILARVSRPTPLVVTAFVDLPDALKPTALYVLRFGFLRALTHLPLLLYVGGGQERSLRMHFPNAVSYPDNALLPKALLAQGMTPSQHMKRNKWLLLQRAMRTYLGFSHYAWLNFDALRHPICPQTRPDFSALMDGTVHLAVVEGELDGSFLVVPQGLLKLFSREVQGLTQMDAAAKRSFSEGSLLRRLVEKFPDLFTLHPMPRKGLLFMTGFEPWLLCEETRALLAQGEPPIRPQGAKQGGTANE